MKRKSDFLHGAVETSSGRFISTRDPKFSILTARGGRKHWTETLFVDHPDLFLPWIEEGKPIAPSQVDGLRMIFRKHGIGEGARVLDLACGIGRISINLAKAGYDVVGVDISPLYLREAEKWAEKDGVQSKTRFYRMDGRQASKLLGRTEEKFDAIINIGTAMGYYGEEDDLRVFRGLRNVTRPRANLVIETVNRDYLVKHFKDHGIFERDGNVWHENRRLDLESSFMRNTGKFYRKNRGSLRLVAEIPVSHRIYSLHELKELLHSASWDYLEAYGSLRELPPLTIDSSHMTIVGSKHS